MKTTNTNEEHKWLTRDDFMDISITHGKTINQKLTEKFGSPQSLIQKGKSESVEIIEARLKLATELLTEAAPLIEYEEHAAGVRIAIEDFLDNEGN